MGSAPCSAVLGSSMLPFLSPVHFYGQRLAQSGDGDFVVTGGRTALDGVIVTSQIISQQAAPIAMDWRLGISHSVYKIEDVAIAFRADHPCSP